MQHHAIYRSYPFLTKRKVLPNIYGVRIVGGSRTHPHSQFQRDYLTQSWLVYMQKSTIYTYNINHHSSQFLSQHRHWSSALKPNIFWQQPTRFTGLPYHRHAIGTFNTCSRVSTPRSLTDTDRGYHIESLRIATTLSPPFPSEGFTDPPNGPAWSQIIHNNYQLNWRGKKT
jgi:hypothetical protein